MEILIQWILCILVRLSDNNEIKKERSIRVELIEKTLIDINESKFIKPISSEIKSNQNLQEKSQLALNFQKQETLDYFQSQNGINFESNFVMPEIEIQLSNQRPKFQNPKTEDYYSPITDSNHDHSIITSNRFKKNLLPKEELNNFQIPKSQILTIKKQDLELFIQDEGCQICNSVEFTQTNHIVFCAVF